GAQGEQGPDGIQGPDGEQGIQGEQGDTGNGLTLTENGYEINDNLYPNITGSRSIGSLSKRFYTAYMRQLNVSESVTTDGITFTAPNSTPFKYYDEYTSSGNTYGGIW